MSHPPYFKAAGRRVLFQGLLLARLIVWLGALFVFVDISRGQGLAPSSAWSRLNHAPPDKVSAERWVTPIDYALFRVDRMVIQTSLAKARRGEPFQALVIGTEIKLPMPDGSQARFKVVYAPVMAPELAAKYPEIRTYAGQGIDDPSATVRMDVTPAGVHVQILSPNGAVYVDPAYREDAEYHVSYFKRDFRKAFNEWTCKVADRELASAALREQEDGGRMLAKTQSGSTLRKYRLVVAATGEYTTFQGGTVGAGLAAIVTAVNRVNQIYESELAVHLDLVGNNDLVIYTNGATDPYTNDDGSLMLGQNQSNLDAVIGNSNYDIGHVFSTGGGGIASWQSVCVFDRKGRGVTGLGTPIGDPFYVDYVCHEIGHQFGGDHTFNSTSGSCSGGNRWAPTAFEPGSGSTILSYAGICPPNDLQAQSDPYFHAGTIDQIQSYLNGFGGGCASNLPSGNTAPTVSAGADYSIPANTPFLLTAAGSDVNGDPITYCWEEMDLGPATSLTDADNGSSPLFRSFLPTNSPLRYLPRLTSVLSNAVSIQEKLPTTTRTLNFRVTVRDNRPGGGGVADDDMVVSVVGSAGPFVVTTPNTNVTWSGYRRVKWNVAGTAGSPINASGVNIHLSTNGGGSFNILLASNVANSGSAVVLLPSLTSSQARIRVQGAGNIFYDVSDANFTITPPSVAPLLVSDGLTLVSETCLPTNGVIDPYEPVTVNAYFLNSGLAPTTNLVATLLSSGSIYDPSAAQSLGAIPPGGGAGSLFSFTPAGNCGVSVPGVVQLSDGAASFGSISNMLFLGTSIPIVTTQVFNNLNPITINDNNPATPYPSTIVVSGVTNPVVKLTATLNSLSHGYPDDVDILLANTNGSLKTVMLMGGCGGNSAISGLSITFDDSAGALPQSQIFSGTYSPTDYYGDTMFPPAPSGPYGTSLSTLAASPNGPWNLYAQDVIPDDSGQITGGWTLTFVTSNAIPVCCTQPPPKLISTTYSNNAVYFSWLSAPGLQYQVQSRTNLASGSWANFGAPFPGTGGLLSTNNLTTGSLIRFFRVVVLP